MTTEEVDALDQNARDMLTFLIPDLIALRDGAPSDVVCGYVLVIRRSRGGFGYQDVSCAARGVQAEPGTLKEVTDLRAQLLLSHLLAEANDRLADAREVEQRAQHDPIAARRFKVASARLQLLKALAWHVEVEEGCIPLLREERDCTGDA